MGFHDCIGVAFSHMTIAELVKVVFRLRNVRRAPGPAGQLKRINEVVNETDTDFFIQRNGTLSRWPGSMQIVVSIDIPLTAYFVSHKVCSTVRRVIGIPNCGTGGWPHTEYH